MSVSHLHVCQKHTNTHTHTKRKKKKKKRPNSTRWSEQTWQVLEVEPVYRRRHECFDRLEEKQLFFIRYFCVKKKREKKKPNKKKRRKKKTAKMRANAALLFDDLKMRQRVTHMTPSPRGRNTKRKKKKEQNTAPPPRQRESQKRRLHIHHSNGSQHKNSIVAKKHAQTHTKISRA